MTKPNSAPGALRSRWAAVGAAVAVTLGAGGLSLSQAAEPTDGGPVYITLDTPCRVADTRSDPTLNIGTKNTPIAAGATNAHQIQITGNSGNCTGIPAEATAVAINLTAINNTNQSHFRVYPADSTLPGTANLVFGPGQTPLSNKVDVGLSAGGAIKIYNHAGTTNAAVDIFGYYIDHTHDDRYYTKTEIGPLVEQIYVAIADDGSVYGGTTSGPITSGHLTSSNRSATGQYDLTFDRPVVECGVATADLIYAGTRAIKADPTSLLGGNPNTMRVVVRNAAGAAENTTFSVIMICPPG